MIHEGRVHLGVKIYTNVLICLVGVLARGSRPMYNSSIRFRSIDLNLLIYSLNKKLGCQNIFQRDGTCYSQTLSINFLKDSFFLYLNVFYMNFSILILFLRWCLVCSTHHQLLFLIGIGLVNSYVDSNRNGCSVALQTCGCVVNFITWSTRFTEHSCQFVTIIIVCCISVGRCVYPITCTLCPTIVRIFFYCVSMDLSSIILF